MRADPTPALNLAIATAGELLPGSAEAHRNREVLLGWLDRTLDEQSDLREVDINALSALYMHCTYAEIEHRHAIKRSINKLVRKTLASGGAARSGPRSHRLATRHPGATAHARRAGSVHGRSFDHAHSFAQVVLYMPSVGMSLLSICVSNMRLAPLQIAGLGHPATTHSECIDYVSVEDDYVGDPACFSEALLRLPKDGQPYRPSSYMQAIRPRKEKTPGQVDIGIAASLMKLSPSFLDACRQISARSKVPVRFHFLTSGGDVVMLLHLSRVATQAMATANGAVMPHQSYMDYVNYLNDMDMFLSPFPFGNTNGIVDAFSVGLPGICKTGREVFERIDGAMFMRAYMPGWMVAETVEEYVEAAVRLANNHEERESLRRYMLEKNVVQRFFEGRPEVFGEIVLDLVEQQRLKTA
jgi:HMW1 domain 2